MKYIAKPDTWFIEGTECVLIDDYRPQWNSGLFRGMRRCDSPNSEGRLMGETYDDEEICNFDEFDEA